MASHPRRHGRLDRAEPRRPRFGHAARFAPGGEAGVDGCAAGQRPGGLAMRDSLHAIWTPLAPSPLLWLTATLLAYVAGREIQRLCRGAPLANPVLIAIVVMGALLEITGTSYSTY